MDKSIDVAIIGAGPYGLSLAAHLANAGIEFRIFGKTMESWKTKMPPGMLLKSYPWASCLFDPNSSLTLKQFYADRNMPYDDSLISVPLKTFMDYGDTFQARFVPQVEDKLLVNLKQTTDGFQATFNDGEVLNARNVVIGVGVHPFKYIPPHLKNLPAEFLTHSGDYGSIEHFAGKKVAVLGSGASATDIAHLLHNKKAMVTIIARTKQLPFMPVPTSNKDSYSLLRKFASSLKPLKRMLSSNSCIGSSWLLKFCANAPHIFHKLPESLRLKIVKNELGASGHWAIKDEVEKYIELQLETNLDSAEIKNGKLNLHLSSADGQLETVIADHLISATGFKIDLTQLKFLDNLFPNINVVENAPILSKNFESSVPGLYFMGPAAAYSFGPICRFVCGARHPVRKITEHLSSKTGSSSTSQSKKKPLKTQNS